MANVKSVKDINEKTALITFTDGTQMYVFRDGDCAMRDKLRSAHLRSGSAIEFSKPPENGQRYQYDVAAVTW